MLQNSVRTEYPRYLPDSPLYYPAQHDEKAESRALNAQHNCPLQTGFGLITGTPPVLPGATTFDSCCSLLPGVPSVVSPSASTTPPPAFVFVSGVAEELPWSAPFMFPLEICPCTAVRVGVHCCLCWWLWLCVCGVCVCADSPSRLLRGRDVTRGNAQITRAAGNCSG